MEPAAAYEGGTGGKFRKRPLRRASATPYDRPPSAIRGLRSQPVSEDKNGWLSKIVDPASRIISRSASRLFSSVFHKRLTATPAAPEENHQSCQEVPAVVCTNPSSMVREQGDSDAVNLKDNSSTLGAQQKPNSDTNGICELELLLKQKTFTRVEFDRLTQLLHSRTIEPSTLQPAVSYEQKGKANVSDWENGIGSRLNGNIPSPVASLDISEEEFASPAELAKEYMGSRPSKVSTSTLRLRNQLYREDALPSNISFGQNMSKVSIIPRSVACYSGNPEPPRNGYMTPRPLGRSAMHKMSRSPYFKAISTNNIMGVGSYKDGYAGSSTSSQWTPTNFIQSDGKRVHKRGSSVLDSDLGSSGPIRRIRQKSNLMPPSKDTRSSPHGNLLPTPSTPLAKDCKQGSVISNQKPLCLGGPEYCTKDLQDAEHGDNSAPLESSVPIPPQSSEIDRKRLHQLDKLVTPKEKSSKLGAITRDELPSKLTTNMLHERALKSMEDIDSFKFFNLQGSVKLDGPSDSHEPDIGSSVSLKQDRVGNTFPSNPFVSGVKVTSENVGIVNCITSATDDKPDVRKSEFSISDSAPVPSIKRPAFQMTAPEDAFDLDDDDYNTRDASDPFTTVNVKLEPKISECKIFVSETATLEKSMPSSKSVSVSSSLLNREAVMKASERPATGEDVGFSFSIAPAPCTSSQPPPTPTMPSPLLDGSSLQKEQITVPTFAFGSKESHESVLSAGTTKISDAAGLKINASSATTTAIVDGSNSSNGGKRRKAEDLLESSVNAASSSCASTTTSLSNGSLNWTSSALSAAAPVTPFSSSSVTSSLSTSTAAPAPAPPMFSMVSSFKFGSGTSTSAPIVSPAMDKSNSTELEGLPVKSSSHLSTSSGISHGTSAAFINTGSSSSSSILATSSFLFSSTSSSSSALATPSLFSSTGLGTSSALSTSSTSNMTTGIFGFSAPAQSSASGLSVPNGSSLSPITSFGVPDGSIFGPQATQAGSGGASQFSPATASQFGSSTSSPAFGQIGSSSVGSSSSPLESTDSGAKPFGSTTVSTGAGSSIYGSSSSSSSLATAAPSLFSSGSQMSTSSNIGGSSSSLSSGFAFGSSSQPSTSFIFGSSTYSSSSFGQSAPTPSSQPSIFGSSTSLSTVFPFGQSAPPTPGFGAGPSAFFTSAVTTTSSASPSPAPAQPTFGLPTSASGFGSGSPGNDQMNVEDSMADDAIQAAVPMVPTFGQQPNPFGLPAVASGGPPIYQFGSQQNPPTASPFQPTGSQNPSPFQTDFSGGSFSLGSGGGDKTGRKIVRVNRNKLRKK